MASNRNKVVAVLYRVKGRRTSSWRVAFSALSALAPYADTVGDVCETVYWSTGYDWATMDGRERQRLAVSSPRKAVDIFRYHVNGIETVTIYGDGSTEEERDGGTHYTKAGSLKETFIEPPEKTVKTALEQYGYTI